MALEYLWSSHRRPARGMHSHIIEQHYVSIELLISLPACNSDTVASSSLRRLFSSSSISVLTNRLRLNLDLTFDGEGVFVPLRSPKDLYGLASLELSFDLGEAKGWGYVADVTREEDLLSTNVDDRDKVG